jgi:hypothetical protein
MTLHALLIALALTATPPPPPSSPMNDTARARALFDQGQKLYAKKKFADAVEKFEQAYAAHPAPALFYNVAKCREQLGETGAALRAYRDYLRMAPSATDREAVKATTANLERQLAEKGVQQLLVLSEPSAVVQVDGRVLGSSPASVELPAGPHQVVLMAQGYERVEKTVTLVAGRSAELSQTLQIFTPPPPPPLTDAKGKPADAPTKLALTPSTTVTTPVVAEAPPRKRVATWVAAGAAGAGVITAVILGSAAKGASTSMNDGTVRTQADVQALHDSAARYGTGANIAYGVAGAALATAVVLYFVEGR